MIYIFKTSVKTREDIRGLRSFLNKLVKDSKWNFDLDDCDKILRVDSQKEISQVVISVLKKAGFDCEELERFDMFYSIVGEG